MLAGVTDPEVLRAHPGGSIEQWVDAVRVLASAPVRARVSSARVSRALSADATHEA